MDELDIKILEQRLGNGDEVTLTRNEFYELANDKCDKLDGLKEKNYFLRERVDVSKAQLFNAQSEINELKKELKKLEKDA